MLSIYDKKFLKYGIPLKIDSTRIVKYLKTIELPKEGNSYVASDEKFESIPEIKELGEKYYKGNFEAGYCNGHNALLNCGEYHGCPEINIAAEDATLFLATQEDIVDGKIDSSKFEEVLLKKGEAILLNPFVLHFSPCRVGKDGFHVAVILSKGTNLDLLEKSDDPLLWKVNKWLLAHKESKQASLGAYIGITGENRHGSLAD